MAAPGDFEIFLTAPPGLEDVLLEEARARGFKGPKAQAGGVRIFGDWKDARRANLQLRGAGRVLVRLGSFRAGHLSQLAKTARDLPWDEVLRPDVPVRVDVTCRASAIHHAGAASERIGEGIARSMGARLAAPQDPDADDPAPEDLPVRVMARIEKDVCTISIDTSGVPLHKRGRKPAVGKAPMRETLAALFLRQSGHDGAEPLLDPMCGSGTFVLEAAEAAAGLNPGRTRFFAFELLAPHDAKAWARERAAAPSGPPPPLRFHGSDRDAGAIRMSSENAARAGVAGFTSFDCRTISEIEPPEGPPGLVIANPPWGARLGDARPLFGLHAAYGQVLKDRFRGWRAALITSEPKLAYATGLPFEPPGAPVANGGMRVQLFKTGPLG